MDAITADGLVKIYRTRKKEVRALDGLDLRVAEGTVLGMLGPNGAGKTTAVRILTTLLRPDSGRATVAGFDIATHAQQIRLSIGLSGQYAAVDENLTGRENLWMFGRLYQLSSPVAKQRADELLTQFDLVDAADRTPKTYSGGLFSRPVSRETAAANPEVSRGEAPPATLRVGAGGSQRRGNAPEGKGASNARIGCSE